MYVIRYYKTGVYIAKGMIYGELPYIVILETLEKN